MAEGELRNPCEQVRAEHGRGHDADSRDEYEGPDVQHVTPPGDNTDRQPRGTDEEPDAGRPIQGCRIKPLAIP